MKDNQLVLREDLRVRDPFILPIKEEGRYYLYGTTEIPGSVPSAGFNAYYSEDLEHWVGPFEILVPFSGFWADRDFWAPEVHVYQGKFYMFASFRSGSKRRATQILVADNPLGLFRPQGGSPQTPEDWECLDGTLHVDASGDPWMVFCHEWTQTGDGEICAVRLSSELDAAIGEPKQLFTASQAPWAAKIGNPVTAWKSLGKSVECFVTDGPFLYRTEAGELLMLWSSFSGEDSYSLGIARSRSGSILGPWLQDKEPLYAKDGGHGMLFKTFSDQLMLALHAPNKRFSERAVFLNLKEQNGNLVPADMQE